MQVPRPLPSAPASDLWLGALRQQRAAETNPPPTGWPGYFYLQSAWHFQDAASPVMKRVHEQQASEHAQTHHTKRTQTHWACAKFHSAVKAIRDRWERRVSGGEPHASGLEAITRCHNNTLRSLRALFLFAAFAKVEMKRIVVPFIHVMLKKSWCGTRKQNLLSRTCAWSVGDQMYLYVCKMSGV